MLLGALLDAGLSLDDLRQGLSALDVEGYRLTAEKVKRSVITATKFNVVIDSGISQSHRSLADILRILHASRLSESIKNKSGAIFRLLGEIEAGIHGIPLDKVQFHELGAIDTIIDIVGTVYAIETMGIEHLYCSPLPAGSGYVSTAHGVLPVPAPATLHLLAKVGAPLVAAPESAPRVELITPTGAVLITSLANFSRPPMTLEKVGYGAGGKDFKGWPNVLRVWLGQEIETAEAGELVLLETNIDDMNPQIYGYLMEKLFEEKAADVWFTPIQMKKNRPAVMLSVLGPAYLEARFSEIILRETSTLGIRVRHIARHMAQREIIEVATSLGKARVKVKRFGGSLLAVAPEYDDCRRIAGERDIPLQEVSRTIESEARLYFSKKATDVTPQR